MLKNYIKIALRNIKKQKMYAFINILGLAIGIATSILILLYIADELGFDKYHEKSNRLYRVVETQVSPNGETRQFGITVAPLGPTMLEEIPGVQDYARVSHLGRMTVQHGENKFYEQFIVTDPNLFRLLDFDFIYGNAATMTTELAKPSTVVLTQSMAQKYFGDSNPLGKYLSTDRGEDFIVAGVIEDPKKNSHLQFNMLISLNTLSSNERFAPYLKVWNAEGFTTYILLNKYSQPQSIEAQLPALLAKYHPADYEVQKTLRLQAITNIHFYSKNIEYAIEENNGDIAYVYIFGAIALFIIIIACINYMNLTTARSVNRAGEIGLRKVVGAGRKQLVGQFLSESILLSFIALFVAFVAVQNILPVFNSFTGKDLALSFIQQGFIIGLLTVLTLLVGVISGSYPALYLSNLNIIQILKGKMKAGSGQARLRQILVVTQFALSIVMLVATLAAFKQMAFIKDKKLGFNQEHLVVVDINSGAARRSFAEIRNDFLQSPDVKMVSVTSRVPGEWKDIRELDVRPDGAPESELQTMNFFGVDQHFLSTFEVELVSGRNFKESMTTDTTAVLINEAAAEALGWDDPVGKTFHANGRRSFTPHVIGVVKDFNFRSLHEKIGPLILGHSHNPVHSIDYFTSKVNGRNIPATLKYLQSVHEKYDPVTPFEYHFLDQQIENFYRNDQRTSTLFGMAAGLAVFIACLGLAGLASFTAEQRTKEIGVRKVLGATVMQIVVLLSKEFSKLVLVALLLAAPISYFFMNKWLENFAYHTNVGVDTFLLAGIIALAIAGLTVSCQAIKAAVNNPVESLRYE